MPIILTLDAGTTGIKCSAFTPEGCLISAYTEAYKTYFLHAGWAQQKPEEQLSAAVNAIRNVLEKTGTDDLAAMVFDGTMNGCIPIDENGDALYDNIIHSDMRTTEQAAKLSDMIPLWEYYQVTGNRIDVRSGLPKYMWMKNHEPDIYKRAVKFVNIKDYLYGKATGRYGCTDYSDASLCNCLDMKKADWAWDILTDAGIDHEKMPLLCPSYDVSAGVSHAFAELTGLPEGLPVAIGGGDGACAAHGAREHAIGASYMNIGSSAWVSVMSDHPVIDPAMRLYTYFDLDPKCYNPTGTVQSAAAAFNWAIANILCPCQDKVDFDALQNEAMSVAPCSDGVMFLPMLMGERTPWWTTRVSGTLIGLMQHHTHAHITRAVYEGIMQSLAICGQIFRENNMPATKLTLIGGGAKSALWGQMAADMFDIPICVHKTPHQATSLGAASAAGVGIGLYKDFSDAAQNIQLCQPVYPDPTAAECYKAHREVFGKLYPLMKNGYEVLCDYRDSMISNNT